MKSRLEPGLLNQLGVQLGSAALTDVVVFFVLALAALLLRILLTGLLAALLTTLTSLAALLAILTGLSTLLFVFLHIVCHEIVLPLNARLGARVESTFCYLVAVAELRVGTESYRENLPIHGSADTSIAGVCGGTKAFSRCISSCVFPQAAAFRLVASGALGSP